MNVLLAHHIASGSLAGSLFLFPSVYSSVSSDTARRHLSDGRAGLGFRSRRLYQRPSASAWICSSPFVGPVRRPVIGGDNRPRPASGLDDSGYVRPALGAGPDAVRIL